MREVLDELIEVRRRGGTAAMATVVRTWRSAPRPAGASMLVTDSGEAVGSVSGGCVEGALFEVPALLQRMTVVVGDIDVAQRVSHRDRIARIARDDLDLLGPCCITDLLRGPSEHPHFVAVREEFADESAAHVTSGAGDKTSFHALILSPYDASCIR